MLSQPDRFNNDAVFAGRATFLGPTALPPSTVNDAAVAIGNPPINDAKLIHRLVAHYAQDPGANVVAETKDVHIVNGATGTLVNVWAAITGVIPATYTCSVDVQRSTAGGAFATVLSGVITMSSGNTLFVPVAGTISNVTLVQGDILRVIIAVSGSSGTHPQGLTVAIHLAETPS